MYSPHELCSIILPQYTPHIVCKGACLAKSYFPHCKVLRTLVFAEEHRINVDSYEIIWDYNSCVLDSFTPCLPEGFYIDDFILGSTIFTYI